MATNIFNEIVYHALGFFCLMLLMHKGSNAYEFVVGGQKGWSVPSDPNSYSYNQWAQKSRFQVGDSLVFNYPSGQDSVIQVSSQDYENCNTNASSGKYSDGHTVIKLSQSGPHYFISGNKNSCLKNEKLVVIVLADRTNKNSNTNQTTTPPSLPPSPSPLPTHSTQALVPSPTPSSQQLIPPPPPGTVVTPAVAPSPPTPGTEVTIPTAAPVSEPPPSTPNDAASVLINFVGSLGAFMASVMVFLI